VTGARWQGRRLWAALHLLDRQLLDRNGRPAGCVDDIELSATGDGSLYVSALLSGPGRLAPRLGAAHFGRWRRRLQELMTNDAQATDQGDRFSGRAPVERGDDEEGDGAGGRVAGDPTRIPFTRVMAIGSHITVAAEADELGSFATERWARDHIVGRLPGSGHDPE
jgi:hypothetical protein